MRNGWYDECNMLYYPLCNAHVKTSNPTQAATTLSSAPSLSPALMTIAPSESPSQSPTALSMSSSASPTLQTEIPTATPSYNPTLPTESPTHSERVSCGHNEWCYSMEIEPVIGATVSESIAIANDMREKIHIFILQSYQSMKIVKILVLV